MKILEDTLGNYCSAHIGKKVFVEFDLSDAFATSCSTACEDLTKTYVSGFYIIEGRETLRSVNNDIFRINTHHNFIKNIYV